MSSGVTHYDIDWIATLTAVLTVVTLYYALITHRILRASARQAAAAEQTVALLIRERADRLQRLRAPVEHVIRDGVGRTNHWIRRIAALGSDLSDSRELETSNLRTAVEIVRSQFFPLAQALLAVDEQIVRTRAAIDILGDSDGQTTVGERASAERELCDLAKRWRHAETILETWQ